LKLARCPVRSVAAATFAFYLADPISSVHEFTAIAWMNFMGIRAIPIPLDRDELLPLGLDYDRDVYSVCGRGRRGLYPNQAALIVSEYDNRAFTASTAREPAAPATGVEVLHFFDLSQWRLALCW
jgi:hypothetical protein